MSTKTDGATFKAFYRDKNYWPEGTYHDEVLVLINGEDPGENISLDKVNDSDVLTIKHGWLFELPDGRGGYIEDRTFEAHFLEWLKEQNTVRIVAELPKDLIEQVKAAISAAGGTVLT